MAPAGSCTIANFPTFGISIAGNNKVIKEFYSAGTDTGYLYPIGERTDRGITGYKSTGIIRTQDQVNAWYSKHPGWKIKDRKSVV